METFGNSAEFGFNVISFVDRASMTLCSSNLPLAETSFIFFCVM